MKQAIIAVAICLAAFAAVSYGRQKIQAAHQGKFAIGIAVTNDEVVWRINTETGALSACDLKNNKPHCTPWGQ